MEACSVREVVLVARAHQIFHLARVNNDALMGLSIRGLNLRLMTSGVAPSRSEESTTLGPMAGPKAHRPEFDDDYRRSSASNRPTP